MASLKNRVGIQAWLDETLLSGGNISPLVIRPTLGSDQDQALGAPGLVVKGHVARKAPSFHVGICGCVVTGRSQLLAYSLAFYKFLPFVLKCFSTSTSPVHLK